MNQPITDEYFRSPLLLDRQRSLLLVVDVQQKLLPLIQASENIEWNIARLMDAATILNVPTLATEQYPKGLGQTVDSLRKRIANSESIAEKSLFSCRECRSVLETAKSQQRDQLVLVGIETHVCILQTAMDFMAAGVDVFIVADAVGSRSKRDYRWALQRMLAAGATIVTTESAMFEWCEVSGTPEFKQISQLAKQAAP